MVERYYFFDSDDGIERIYDAQDFARFHHQIIGNGVSNDSTKSNLTVTAKANSTTVRLGTGYMFINGYMYENTSTLDLETEVAESTSSRIDRVIIRFDNNPEEMRINAYVKKGIPSANPKPPELTRTGYIYEMSVAQLDRPEGKSYIETGDILDERGNEDVCGYIPLHNFYRAFAVDNEGLVSLKNQSFVNAYTDKLETIQGNTGTDYVNNQMQFIPNMDKQDEVPRESDWKVFKPKTDGVYMFTLYVRLEKELPAGAKLRAYMQQKDKPYDWFRVFLFNETSITGSSDVFFFGTSMRNLGKDYELELYISTRKAGGNIRIAERRLEISKVQ